MDEKNFSKHEKKHKIFRLILKTTAAAVLIFVLVFGIIAYRGNTYFGAATLGVSKPPENTPGPVSGDYITSVQNLGYGALPKLMSENPGKNLMFSPLGLSICGTMIMSGAGGNTYTELKNTLGYGNMSDSVIFENNRTAYGLSYDNSVKLRISNSVWYDKGFKINQSYLDNCTKNFYADLYQQDFNDQGTVNNINKWCNNKTSGYIPKIIGSIQVNVVMYLINAISFEAKWENAFPEKNTAPGDFYKAGGNTATCDFMKNSGYKYKGTDQFQAAAVPYKDGKFSMVLVLPPAGKTPADLLADSKIMSLALNYNNWTYSDELSDPNDPRSYEASEANVTMPKFTFASEMDLKNMMTALGVKDAFDIGAADFSKMDGKKDLYLSEIKQKTYIEVNEKETKAFAINWGVMNSKSAPYMSAVNITFDRPFLFAIVNGQGLPFFMGVVNDPAQK